MGKMEEYTADRKRIEQALGFALKYHGGKIRKGSGEPFITHPAEVMTIMNGMGLAISDPNLMIAGILHDTVEDTDATIEMIRDAFGEDVAALVASHTEDKSLSWKERKQMMIDELQDADLRVKILVLSDMLANLRTMARDHKKIGEKLWERFNAPKELQTWYYHGAKDALSDLEFNEDTKSAYLELVKLVDEIFDRN